MKNIHITEPQAIQEKSFSIIQERLTSMGVELSPDIAPIVKRVIHTTADFDFATTLCFSPDVVENTIALIRKSSPLIVCDTKMCLSGIDINLARSFNIELKCFTGDADVCQRAHAMGVTRSSQAMVKAKAYVKGRSAIYAIGNAPTALLKLCSLYENEPPPALIIGVPVGFVNVLIAKESLTTSRLPYIVNSGYKGGSTVAVAICNALLHMARGS